MTIIVPGRTELAGNHTDHQGGHVLAAAVNLLISGTAEATGDNRVLLMSNGFGRIQVDLDRLDKTYSTPGTAEALVRGVLDYFRQKGYGFHGFCGALRSDIPAGAGLSSSAAFSVWVGRTIQKLFRPGEISPMTLALAARYAENVHFGKPCGLMDQCACAYGGITAMSFREAEPEVRRISTNPEELGYILCVVQTGGDHRDLTEDYAVITQEMGAVAAHFGRGRLCGIEEKELTAAIPELRKEVGDRAVLRALHFVQEDRRAQEMAKALEARDMDAYLAGMDASGRSSAELLQNSFSPSHPRSQGISLALALSRSILAGNGAARVHGGGFAGTIQAVMPADLEESYRRKLESVFGAGSCRRLGILTSDSAEMTMPL